MPPTSEELLELARACAERVDLPPSRYPSFSEVEEQCEDEYERLIEAMHEDEIFEPVDLAEQQKLVDRIKASLPVEEAGVIDDLVDNHVRHLWLQQEGAYYVGLAVGLRAAGAGGARRG